MRWGQGQARFALHPWEAPQLALLWLQVRLLPPPPPPLKRPRGAMSSHHLALGLAVVMSTPGAAALLLPMATDTTVDTIDTAAATAAVVPCGVSGGAPKQEQARRTAPATTSSSLPLPLPPPPLDDTATPMLRARTHTHAPTPAPATTAAVPWRLAAQTAAASPYSPLEAGGLTWGPWGAVVELVAVLVLVR